MKGKEMNWNKVTVMYGGVELQGVESVTFKISLEELQENLKEAELKEDYELCAKIKTSIDNYKN